MCCPELKLKFLVVNVEPILTRVLKRIPKKEDPPAHDLFLLLSLLPLRSSLRQEKQNNGIREEEGAGRGAGWFIAMSGLAPSPLLGPLGLLGIYNPGLLPIWGM